MAARTWIAVLLSASVLLPASRAKGQPAGPSPPSADVIEQFDIALDGDLSVPVVCNGKRYLFCVDTGATFTVFDTSLQPLLGRPVEDRTAGTAGAEIQVQMFVCPEASVGSLRLRDTIQTVGQVDMKGLRQASGKDYYGTLGMDFLGKHIVHIDPNTRKLSLLKSFDKRAAGRPFPVTFEDEMPFVTAVVPGWCEERFLMDTGSAGSGSCDARPLLFNHLVMIGKLSCLGNGLFEAPCGTVGGRKGRLVDALVLGDFRHRNLVVDECRVSTLGLNYWLRYVVTADFPNRTLYLIPSDRFQSADRVDLSGLHFLWKDGQVVIEFVDKGSPAAEVGVKPKDVLLKVAGSGAEVAGLSTFRSLLSMPGKRITITVRRGGETMEFCLPLSEDWRKVIPKTPPLVAVPR